MPGFPGYEKSRKMLNTGVGGNSVFKFFIFIYKFYILIDFSFWKVVTESSISGQVLGRKFYSQTEQSTKVDGPRSETWAVRSDALRVRPKST